jgi:hypothetical protein
VGEKSYATLFLTSVSSVVNPTQVGGNENYHVNACHLSAWCGVFVTGIDKKKGTGFPRAFKKRCYLLLNWYEMGYSY